MVHVYYIGKYIAMPWILWEFFFVKGNSCRGMAEMVTSKKKYVGITWKISIV